MADLTFTRPNKAPASWLNAINDHVYNDTPGSGSYVHGSDVVSFVQSGSGLATTTVAAQLRKSEFFDSIADLRRWESPANEVTAFVRGYYSPGDGGGGMYRWNSADTSDDNGGTVILPEGHVGAGRWNRVYDADQYNVHVFGAKGNWDGASGTDDTDAFERVAAAINAAGGGRMKLGFGRTYRIWPTGVAANTLMTLTDVTSFAIDGNGSTIKAGNVNASNPYCVQFDGGANIEINDVHFDSDYTALDPTNGPTWIAFKNGTKRIAINRVKASHGRRGLEFQGWGDGSGTDDFAGRVRGITINGYETDTVYYPLICEGSGDDLYARGFMTRNAGRSYFIFNVENHDVWLDSEQGGPFSDCLLKGYGSADAAHGESSGLRNIKLKYFTNGRYAGSGNQGLAEGFVAIECSLFQLNPGAVRIDNIEIDLQVNVLNATDKPYHAVVFRKVDNNSAFDATARGHIIDNVKIKGVIRNWDNAQAQYAIDVCSLAGGQDWTGEAVMNVSLEDLQISEGASAVLLNGQAFTTAAPAVTLRNIYAAGALGQNNIANGAPITQENVFFSNLSSFDVPPTAYTPAWTADSSNPAIGNGSLIGVYERKGKRVTVSIRLTAGSTTAFGTGGWHFSLPYAAAGAVDFMGTAYALDAGTAFKQGVARLFAGQSTFDVVFPDTASPAQANIPFTWAQNDQLIITLTYLAA